MSIAPSRTLLQRYFAGVTEHAFMEHLGIGDAPLTEYLAEMLARFIHMDRLFVIHNANGEKLTEVANMLIEAEGMPPEGRTRREVFRHIGDYTLFWTGVYPEALGHSPARGRAKGHDRFVDYCTHGKRAYYIASTIPADQADVGNELLERLSAEFELCAYGLNEVRKEWERRDPGGPWQLLVVN